MVKWREIDRWQAVRQGKVKVEEEEDCGGVDKCFEEDFGSDERNISEGNNVKDW